MKMYVIKVIEAIALTIKTTDSILQFDMTDEIQCKI